MPQSCPKCLKNRTKIKEKEKWIVLQGSPVVRAYISEVRGTLIGADLLNLNRITKLGAPWLA